ncbi:MAG TPA: tRNA pseudouridine(38-40) synthase TruA [Thiotrichaceae bacterium]|jgi:tRNA pseudouridine38-40 synthase|nr:tRNA pseudouridine(38-40) synthase TruA [Thiotrichaceae bacterium]HIM08894.1 tRNA pseudouridine(38-40) synthase TruA [Gammaproteobacteria bacterium]
MKIALGIEYAGCHYYGWQKQDISPTVQEVLETALSKIADENIRVVCAGRTDTGVHALQQVVHFETSSQRESQAWILGTNTILPNDVAVTWVMHIDDDFHARFSAQERTYQYIILNRQARPAIFNGLVTWQHRELDFDRMQQASQCLIGEHDFSSYRAVACQANSPVRTVHKLEINKLNDWFVITVCANAFLHHMIRNIAGVLMAIGIGKEDVDWAAEVLAAKDRTAGGITAKPDGLYLANIKYPEKYTIPSPKTLLDKFGLSL